MHLLAVSLILYFVSMSVKGWVEKLPPKNTKWVRCRQFLLGNFAHAVNVHFLKNERLEWVEKIKVSSEYYSNFIDIIRRKHTRSYDIKSFPLPAVGFEAVR